MFGRRKAEKPKNPLGIVLYEYDRMLNTELKDVIKSVRQNKRLSPARTGRVFDNITLRLNSLIGDITKDKLKVDYRSDKARDLIIDMFRTIDSSFEKIRNENFDLQSPALSDIYSKFEYVLSQREIIKKKLKDIECDYT